MAAATPLTLPMPPMREEPSRMGQGPSLTGAGTAPAIEKQCVDSPEQSL